ncbi:unnamed protein product [Clavelina lepadiformis]|uniref:Uncharacterized protein n=1 Tax=Clavelina lepadiformis TaxID=159417 RepID=A0ABP0FIK8_CLALP
MTSRPRGSALIVCVSRFKSELGISDRLGSDMDRKNLTSLLNQLEFSIVHVDNCTADEMQSAVKEFSKKDKLHDADCVVVILLSHGKGNFLYGSDGGKVRVDTLVQNFDNAHCPALRNKPKIFLIQGCRDDEIASNIAHVVTDGPPLSQDCCEAIDHSLSEANDRRRLPTCSDVVIGFSALPGRTATRNTVHGSWYIQALVRIISKHAKDKDFAEMLTLVNGFLRSKSLEQEVQSDWHETPEFRSSLCKKLYFYPGIFAKSSFRE